MSNKFETLLKNEDNEKGTRPASASKKIADSKKRLRNICSALKMKSQDYDPAKTVLSISAYINSSQKLDRMLYSEISSFIVGLDENERGVFSTNLDRLLDYVLDGDNDVNLDVRKICIKIYDHFQLNLIQIENARAISEVKIKSSVSQAMKIETEDLHKEVNNIQKEHITILGIFAAIILAFVGSFTFSTSVLSNVGKVNVFYLAFIAIIIGSVFLLMIQKLLDFLREINGIKDNEGTIKEKNPKISGFIKGVLAGALVLSLLAAFISLSSYPKKIFIGDNKYLLVEDSANN